MQKFDAAPDAKFVVELDVSYEQATSCVDEVKDMM